jgi:hypothetical protein
MERLAPGLFLKETPIRAGTRPAPDLVDTTVITHGMPDAMNNFMNNANPQQRSKKLLSTILITASLGFGGACGISDSEQESDLSTASAAITQSDAPAMSISFTAFRLLVWPDAPDTNYHALTLAETGIFQQLLVDLWQPRTTIGRSSELMARARQIGFELHHIAVEGERFWVLREPTTNRHGRGSYMIRDAVPAAATILLQTPHVYFDFGTGFIGAAIMMAGGNSRPIHAMFTNSSERYPRDANGSYNTRLRTMDPAHNAAHTLNSATSAVINQPNLSIVQLHGFDGDSANMNTAGIQAVVSAGDPQGSSLASTRVSQALAPLLAPTTKRFPEDTALLGGTQNQQGRIARAAGVRFVHIEISGAERDRLRKNRAAAASLAPAVLRSLVAMSGVE